MMRVNLRALFPILVFLVMLPNVSMSQQAPPEIEILSKDDARALFAMSRAQWVKNVRHAVISGGAKAMGNPETALTMIMSTPAGVLMVRPDYSGEGLKPEFIQVTVGYRYPQSALLTEALINDAIKAAEGQMEPEFNVIGDVERVQDGIAVFFIIREAKP